ncbi:hypothetical protein [Mesorhizobium comanense]|uniref:hypothetical protein n=1 Tax=Mesorhizobium comanense TaxID=2502215 RepID=UPI0010F7A73F|nr:hypothetical protein [Mesorhizobium comanense]
MTPVQKLAVAYAFLFFGVVAIGFRSLSNIEFPPRFFTSLPHILIGGIVVCIGFALPKRVLDHFAAA